MASFLILLSLWAPLDERKAVKAVRRAFSEGAPTAETIQAKNAALDAIAPHDSARVAKALMDAYAILEREAEPLVEKRRPLLEKRGGRPLLPFRLELGPIRQLQEKITQHLRRLRAPESIREQMARLAKTRGGEVPHALKRTLAHAAAHLAESDHKLALGAPTKKSVDALGIRLEAIRHLGRAGQPAGPFVVKMLSHRRPLLRELAASTLQAIRWPGGIAPLIARLGQEDLPRVRTTCARSLERLTGMRLGTSGKAWSRWLAAEGAPYVAGQKPLGGHTSTVESDAAGGYYFGIPQDGRSILYVYDASDSMKAKFRRGKKHKDDERKRVDVASAELIKALGSLTPKQRFNIIAFSNRLERYEQRMIKATKANVKAAQKWVREMPLRFGTNTYDALELAFNTAGRGSFDRYYPLEADTVFLLSDGAPTVMKPKGGIGPDTPDQIRAAVLRWNPFGRIVVHTIGIGLGKKRVGFMEGLAKDNGGRFVAR